MQAADNPRFTETLNAMARQYPAGRWTDDHATAYWQALRDLPLDAVTFAIAEAPASSPQFVPPAPMLRAIAARRAIELRAQGEQLRLDGILPAAVKTGGRVDRDKALQEFYRLCDEALDKQLGDQINGDNQHILEGLVIIIGAVYGFDRQAMASYATGLRYTWGPGDPKTGRQLCLAPGVVVRGLRKVPSVFIKFPTEGMLRSLILGEAVSVWPDEWLTEAARAMRPTHEAAQPMAADSVAAAIDSVLGSATREPGCEG